MPAQALHSVSLKPNPPHPSSPCAQENPLAPTPRLPLKHRGRALRKEDGSYAPAYMLPDARLERVGRERAERHTPTPLEDASTAGVIIVGDEILSAKVKDVNTRFLCRELHAGGWLVPRVVIVRDCVPEIAAEVRGMSSDYDAVIIAGGIGPTVDDVSMAALAGARAGGSLWGMNWGPGGAVPCSCSMMSEPYLTAAPCSRPTNSPITTAESNAPHARACRGLRHVPAPPPGD